MPVCWPFFPPLLWPESLLPPSFFPHSHILEPKVFVSVCEDKCCLKGMLDNKFRGAIFHPLTRMKEPSSTKTEAVWTLMELHGQSSYVMYQGCFVSSKNGTLKLSSQLFFPQGLCSLTVNFYQRLGRNFDFFALLLKTAGLFLLRLVAFVPSPLCLVYGGILVKVIAVVSLTSRRTHIFVCKNKSPENALPSSGRQQYRNGNPFL